MKPQIYLIGTGMGNPETLTLAARCAIDRCTLLIGAPRMLEPYQEKVSQALQKADEIAACIALAEDEHIGVLLSGDIGFYSGAAALREKLSGYDIHAIPGISSLSYFCAKIGLPWQDVKVVSAHGRKHNAEGEIQRSRYTFLLTGGGESPNELCARLTGRGLGALTVWVGEALSYPQERIICTTAREAADMSFSDLAVMLVENPAPICREYAAPSLTDDVFIRGKTPMSKEEVRVLALSKLRVRPEHVVWDVGAGSGSVSVELALAAAAGRVYAIEHDADALELIEQNRAAFQLTNLYPVAGLAPQALEPLPPPDRVFLGGTSGRMQGILQCVLEKNPLARIVAAAVTLETLTEAMREFSGCGLAGIDAVQISATRAKPVGGYHMMLANNPVWLISGEGKP